MSSTKIIIIEPKKEIRIEEVTDEHLGELLLQTEEYETIDSLVRDSDGTLFLVNEDSTELLEQVTTADARQIDDLVTKPTDHLSTRLYFNWFLGCNSEGEVLNYYTDENDELASEVCKDEDYIDFDVETMKVISFNDTLHLEKGIAFIILTKEYNGGVMLEDAPFSLLNHYMTKLKSIRN
jgi:hypothetical protein